MKTRDVAVIDYGVGNLLSVRRALEAGGGRVIVTHDPAEVLAASHVVLPGVGAFSKGMKELSSVGADALIVEVVRRGTPVLGICLGMQLLFDRSEEFGNTAGLGVVPGSVVQIPDRAVDGSMQKIPHIGWSDLEPVDELRWSQSILEGLATGSAAYFVHSFMAVPEAPSDLVAVTRYGGHPIASVIRRGAVHACQFHPEKSGPLGLALLERFLSL